MSETIIVQRARNSRLALLGYLYFSVCWTFVVFGRRLSALHDFTLATFFLIQMAENDHIFCSCDDNRTVLLQCLHRFGLRTHCCLVKRLWVSTMMECAKFLFYYVVPPRCQQLVKMTSSTCMDSIYCWWTMLICFKGN